MADREESGYDIRMDEDGLVLNLGDELIDDAPADPDAAAPFPRPVSDADRAELARVERELLARWPETKIDPSLERIETLMDFLGHPERA